MVRYLLLAVAAVAVAFGAATAGEVLEKTETGSPKIQSIDAIAFAPDGTLLIGDSKGSQFVAIATKDTTAKKFTAKAIEKFEEKIADKLGTKAEKITFGGLAVNPASGTTYVVVKNAGKSVLITVDGDGKIGEVTFDKVDHVAVPLPKNTLITDLAYTKGRILVSAQDKEAFKSAVHSIPTPLDPSKKKAISFNTETYHVAHKAWETKAPMSTLIPLERNGKQYVVGAFACTPIVRYALDEVKEGKVVGNSVIELGHGNRPQGMFAYSGKDKKQYLLVNSYRNPKFGKKIGPSEYWVARVDMVVFDVGEDKVNKKAEWRVEPGTTNPTSDKVKVVDAYSGTRYMDKLNDTHAVAIREDGKSFRFEALELP